MIYFVRHRATDWNENKNAAGEKDPKFQGRIDIPLNQNGIKQAQVMEKILKDKQFDRVICSPLTRAKQTCSLIYHGSVPVEFDERIIERDFGEFEGKIRNEFDYHNFCNRFSNQKYERAETIENVEKRVFNLLDELREKPNQDVLIISHGGVGCVLISYFKGIPENGDYTKFLLPHGQPLILDFKELVKENNIDKTM